MRRFLVQPFYVVGFLMMKLSVPERIVWGASVVCIPHIVYTILILVTGDWYLSVDMPTTNYTHLPVPVALFSLLGNMVCVHAHSILHARYARWWH